MRRGQTATEYLIILAVVIVIALIVVGVLGGIPSIGGGTSKNANLLLLKDQKVGIENYAVSSNGTTLLVRNNNPELIRITNIRLNNSDNSVSVTLKSGERKEINLDFSSNAQDQYRYPISINYTVVKNEVSYSINSDLYLIGKVSGVSSGGSDGSGGASLIQTSSIDCFGEDGDSDGYNDICTCDDLKNISTAKSASYELLYDIDFDECDASYTTGSGWAPIDSFSGVLHGRGNVISNLFIDRSGTVGVGLFGLNFDGSVYDLGLVSPNVTGNTRVGALVGDGGSGTHLVSNSYSYGGTITANGGFGGGLIGYYVEGTGIVEYSYAANVVTGNPSGSGCLYSATDTATAVFCDGDVSGLSGQSTPEMYSSGQYLGAGWDFETKWVHVQGSEYPKLYGHATVSGISSNFSSGSGTALNPYIISNCYQLQRMGTDLDAYYQLSSDIDCSTLNSGAGFAPIDSFSGNFDGNSNVISNLEMNWSTKDGVGLFGTDFSGDITNVGIVSPTIIGSRYIGALVGRTTSSGDGAFVNNSYSYGGFINATHGAPFLGGFVGYYNDNAGDTITNSYAANSLGDTGAYYNCFGGTVRVSSQNYCDQTVSGDATPDHATGETTANMQTQSTYSGWDFASIWTTNGDTTYPQFQ